MKKEKGFHFYDFPALSGGAAQSLIVILHGHESHPDKYIKWAEQARLANPDADVLLLRAPIALKASEAQKRVHGLSGVDDLYTWFRVGEKKSERVRLILKQAFNRRPVVDKLNRWIDHQLAQRSLKDKDLAFIGFSMGGIISVQAAVGRKEECAAVVCHSGVVLPFTKVRKKPEMLMIMGDKDDLFFVPKNKPQKTSRLRRIFRKVSPKLDLTHKRSIRRLQKSGVPVQEKIFPGQSHVITESSWQEAAAFVAKNLGLKK